MGASILPTTIYKNKLYFLFGKERDIDDTPGWSDFGGGTDNNESYLETAVREGGEEMTGFLGNDKDIKHMLTKYGTYNIDYKSNGHGVYRVHIFPMKYDALLPHYYNNNQRFLQKRLDNKIIRDSKIFEKAEIRWICIDELSKMRSKFRSFYRNIVDLLLNQKDSIRKFINPVLNKTKQNIKKIRYATKNNKNIKKITITKTRKNRKI
jgi:hypothetical protein